MNVSTTVYGEVLGKPRPRVTRHGVYVPKKFVECEKRIADIFRAFVDEPTDDPVALRIVIQRPLPESKPKRIESEPDAFTPDLDNVVKLVLDALNKVVYKDDKQVVSIQAEKLPRVRGVREQMRIEVFSVD